MKGRQKRATRPPDDLMTGMLPRPKSKKRGVYVWGPFDAEEELKLKTAGFRFATPPFGKQKCARADDSPEAREIHATIAFSRRLNGRHMTRSGYASGWESPKPWQKR